MGFERNRFVDNVVDHSLAEELICSICMNVFDNAVSTDCVHTFCLKCVQQVVASNTKTCPICRSNFTPKRRRDDNNLIIVGNYVFRTNRIVNNIISKLKIKCDYEVFGCKKLVELSSLESHLKECPFKRCKTCEMPFISIDGHNCIQLLFNDRNNWKTKYFRFKEKTEEKESEERAKYSKLEENGKQLKQLYDNCIKSLDNTRSDNSILIKRLTSVDTYMETIVLNGSTFFQSFVAFNSQNFRLYVSNTNERSYQKSFGYKSINQFMYCLNPKISVIIIRLDTQFYTQIVGHLVSKNWFKSIGCFNYL